MASARTLYHLTDDEVISSRICLFTTSPRWLTILTNLKAAPVTETGLSAWSADRPSAIFMSFRNCD